MSVESVINDWKSGLFKPVNWFEGEEDFFIDRAISYAEKQILPPEQTSFNLTVFYGKDAVWSDVINSCRRYPMFSDRQVVLLKEAQQMKDLDKLESYLENPLSSTVFVVSYKEKKLDARRKFTKLIKEKGVLVTTRKLYEKELHEWTQRLVQHKKFSISARALAMVVEHIGNDLSRIENELDKLMLNLGSRTAIREDDVEKYIGVSRDYNVYELQSALAEKDMTKSIRILRFFEANPKAGPAELVLPSLYSFFSKVYMIFGMDTSDEKTIAAATGIHPYYVKQHIKAAKLYGFQGTENVLLLLHQYNLKRIGVGAAGMNNGSLLKELIVKMIR